MDEQTMALLAHYAIGLAVLIYFVRTHWDPL